VSTTGYPERLVKPRYTSALLAIWAFANSLYSQLFGAATTLVVDGAKDEWLQHCCDALNAANHFSVERVFEDSYQIKAKYRMPPVWATLTIALVPEGRTATRIHARATVLPNAFTLVFAPGRRVLARFTRALGR